jgi:outer membrane immunogenic protein
MQNRLTSKSALLLAVIAVLGSRSFAIAQSTGGYVDAPRPEVAVAYDFIRTNAPPGGSEGINLNGGSATVAWPVRHSNLAVAADLTVVHAGNIATGNYDLTLTSYTGGLRYHRPIGYSLQPFVQILAGGAHAGGSLVTGANSTTSNAGFAFAANLGGGLDLRIYHRISLRLFEADYLVTTFDNQANNHQNDFRLSTGVVLHF